MLLTFVILARNDDYMGNARWRLETTLDFLGRSLCELGRLDDVEVLIVDWQSAHPLHLELSLSQKIASITRFLIVPSLISNSINFDCDFPRPVILNTGIRRSKGEFIIQTLGDVLWTPETLRLVFDKAKGDDSLSVSEKEILYVIGRKEIPYEFVATNPSTSEVEAFINYGKMDLVDIPPYPYLLVPGDSLMMHRNMWFALRGFDEKLQYWGWSDCDIILRMRLVHKVISKHDDPALCVYHLNHIGPEELLAVNNRPVNPSMFNDFTVNASDWGLGSFTFPEYPVSEIVNYIEIPPVYVKHYRIVHVLNLLRFTVLNMNLNNICFMYNCILLILEQSPKCSFGKMIHSTLRFVKRRIFLMKC
jgi:glycosyltransferase involved in cell wall biosynthesis